MAGVSKACCSIPPVVSKDYTAKGSYQTIGGLKTYVTGTESAKKAIFVIYDIFGFFPQTLQGADILATSDPDHQYRVFIPDFFEGNPADISWYPPKDEETKQKLNNFFATAAAPPKTLTKIPGVFAEANKLGLGGNGFIKWGIIGYCWGAKVANIAVGQDINTFHAAAQLHPAMVDPEDAKKIKIPMAVLASKDEPVDAVKGYEQNLSVAHHVETFSTQIHGWMAARADLDDPEVRKEYERGYQTLLTFFHEHL